MEANPLVYLRVFRRPRIVSAENPQLRGDCVSEANTLLDDGERRAHRDRCGGARGSFYETRVRRRLRGPFNVAELNLPGHTGFCASLLCRLSTRTARFHLNEIMEGYSYSELEVKAKVRKAIVMLVYA